MHIELWPLEKIRPYPKNARRITEKAVDKVAASIREFGWRQPIVLDKEGIIVIGHVRRLAAIKLGLTEAPVHVADNLSDAQIRALRLMDNRSHEEVLWDPDLLGPELFDLKALGLDLNLTGFNSAELDKFFVGKFEDKDDAAPAVPVNPVSRPGDVWVCGTHRVLCGDARLPDAFGRLFGDRKARLMWTDPPYGVNYVGKTKQALTIENDGSDQLSDLLRTVFENCQPVIEAASPVYVAHPAGPLQPVFWNSLPDGWRVHEQLVWVKDSMVLGHSDYHYRHEPIIYGYTAGPGRPGRGKHEGSRWFGDHAQTTVLEVQRPKRSEEHPTMKPVELVVRCITNSSERGDVVLDPFLGSGSTMIACERTGRVCMGLEIDPRYADVIVTRWQDFTGKVATLEGHGATFAHVREGRLLEAEDQIKEQVIEMLEAQS